MVASVRWRGYTFDEQGIRDLKTEAQQKIGKIPTAPRAVKHYIGEVLSEEERLTFTSTGKVTLEKIAAAKDGACPFGPCDGCNHTGRIVLPAAERARNVLDARFANKEIELYDKLLRAGRLHASLKVIGTLSSRMSGDANLNVQGIKKTENVRSKFRFAFGNLDLWGGDFSGFEVVLADACYNDPLLRRDLLTCELCRDCQVEKIDADMPVREFLGADGLKKFLAWKRKDEVKKEKYETKEGRSYSQKSDEQILSSKLKKGFACPQCGSSKRMKIHALFGVHVYPHMTYDEIKATDGTDDDKYTKCKSAVFAMLYGGEAYTLMTRLGVPMEVAEAAYQKFIAKYKGVGIARQKVIDAFQSMRQTGGLGSKITWRDPDDSIESLLGFKRFFLLENRIVKALFNLAQDPPKEWKNLPIRVMRRDRLQTASGAVQSALYSAAFQMQAGNMRAAANHVIQSSGAQITKFVQRKIWDLQPAGVNEWVVQPMNVHDEILCPVKRGMEKTLESTVFEAVETFRPRVPLIEMEWKKMANWAEKH
jgi:hypothetical protein